MSGREQPTQHDVDARGARVALLEGLPVTSREIVLAGIPTAVLEGGDGPPIVLVHEQGKFAARWMRIIPDLVTTHRVVAPDLPGHGAYGVGDGVLDADRMSMWLRELIDRTCDTPPLVVGHMLGGAIAARFAVDHPEGLRGLVLIDSFGLRRFRPTPRLAVALVRYIARPSGGSFDRLYERCAVDLDGLRAEMGERWEPFRESVVAGAKTPALKAALPALMRTVGVKRIPPKDLARISVPTTLSGVATIRHRSCAPHRRRTIGTAGRSTSSTTPPTTRSSNSRPPRPKRSEAPSFIRA